MKKIIAHNPINFRHSLNRGLVGAWIGPWQQPKGTLVADGCRGSNGRLTNMDATTDWVRGPVRGMRALDFDGTNDRVVIPYTLRQEPAVTSITLSCWIRLVHTGSFPAVLSKFTGPGSGDRTLWFFDSSAGYVPSYQVATTGTPGTTAPAASVWSHIAVTQNGTAVTHYLNGAANGTGTETDTNNGAGEPWTIGSQTDNAVRLTGQISEVRIYDRALSAAEIYQLYRLTQQERHDLYNYQPSVPEFA